MRVSIAVLAEAKMLDMALIVVPFVALIGALLWMFGRSQNGSGGHESAIANSAYNGPTNHTQTPAETSTHAHHHHHVDNNSGGGW